MANKNLTGLIPGKTYNVVVRAKDSDGNYSPNSIIYQFTAPVKDLSGNQLVAKNIAVVTALAQSSASVVGGALTAGGLDDNGIKFAGKAQLADIWNNTASAIASMTGSANTGAVLINSTGILGYQFYTSSSGIANFFLNTADGNAYFRGTVYAGAGQIGGFTIGASSLYAGSGSNFVGIIPASLPFFAGATDNIGTGSKFSVTNAGAITSTSGSIGGWTLASTQLSSNGVYLNSQYGYIQAGSTAPNIVVMHSTQGLYAGASTFASSPFSVDLSGNLKATSASVTGTINATGGQFTGSVNAGTIAIGANLGGTSASGFYIDSNNYWVKYPSVAASFSLGGSDVSNRITYNTTSSALIVNGINIGRGSGNISTNLAFGQSALNNNTIGEYNVAIGYNAVNNNSTGSYNIGIGYQANNTGGDSNIGIGNNSLYVYSSNSNAMLIGNYSGFLMRDSGFNIGMGASALFYHIGGSANIAIGTQAMFNSGDNTGLSNYNIAIGSSALYSNTKGISNVSIGYKSLLNNTSGSKNVVLGENNMINNTTGNYNFVIGQNALQSATDIYDTVSIGRSTLLQLQTGSGNIALGFLALRSGTTGNYNIGIGYGSGSNSGGGNGNVIIGGNDGSIINGTDRNIIISDGYGNLRIKGEYFGGLGKTTIIGLASVTSLLSSVGLNVYNSGTSSISLDMGSSGELNLHRVNSASEGGQINFNRSTDDTSAWSIDVYGSTANPSLRIINQTSPSVAFQINNDGTTTLNGAPLKSASAGVGTTSAAGVTRVQHNLGVTPLAVVVSLRSNSGTTSNIVVGSGSVTSTDFGVFANFGGAYIAAAYSWVAIAP